MFCFINPTVSVEEVVNRGKLFEEVDENAEIHIVLSKFVNLLILVLLILKMIIF